MGGSGSKLEKQLSELHPDERYLGLENFGNTCYANSVLQALYHCIPFREHVLQYGAQLHSDSEENLLTCLADLFQQASGGMKRLGVLAPKRFVQRLKRDNELFRSFMHQDAHDFFLFLVNDICEILEREEKVRQAGGASMSTVGSAASFGKAASVQSMEGCPSAGKVWLNQLFQGKFINETKCLQCETVTSREEDFYEIPLEIEQNCSLTSCLRRFSSTETLDADDKFSCDTCGCLQEAQKRMKIKELPPVLCLNFKRFKYLEDLQRLRKLMYRVVFPFQLKLCNTSDDCPDVDTMYNLFAVIVHIGSGLHHGHYIANIKVHGQWLTFDDEEVRPSDEAQVQTCFGSSQEYSNHAEHSYMLFYAKEDLQSQAEGSLLSSDVPMNGMHHVNQQS
eukprot:jgi/Astpho2/112/e_gw1.00004.43.1_t